MINDLRLSMRPKYPTKPAGHKSSAEAVTKNISRLRGPVEKEKKGQANEEKAKQFSREKMDAAQGKKPMKLVDEDSGSANEEEKVEMVKAAKKPVRKTKKQPSTTKSLDAPLSMSFSGTRYPHPETMKELGISRDVGYLFEMCGLVTFMSYQFEAHQLETCQFLVSMDVVTAK